MYNETGFKKIEDAQKFILSLKDKKAIVKEVKKSIREKGYRTFDINDNAIHQIGLSKEGRLYLLDSECARYKTVFHALFDKIKRVVLKKF